MVFMVMFSCVLPGVISIRATVKLICGLKVQRPLLKLLQHLLLLLHHDQLKTTTTTHMFHSHITEAAMWDGGSGAVRLFKGPHLVFAPQQAVVLLVDAGADKVHAVVLNSEVEISKPENQS